MPFTAHGLRLMGATAATEAAVTGLTVEAVVGATGIGFPSGVV